MVHCFCSGGPNRVGSLTGWPTEREFGYDYIQFLPKRQGLRLLPLFPSRLECSIPFSEKIGKSNLKCVFQKTSAHQCAGDILIEQIAHMGLLE
jgi:hypothetical protein